MMVVLFRYFQFQKFNSVKGGWYDGYEGFSVLAQERGSE